MPRYQLSGPSDSDSTTHIILLPLLFLLFSLLLRFHRTFRIELGLLRFILRFLNGRSCCFLSFETLLLCSFRFFFFSELLLLVRVLAHHT